MIPNQQATGQETLEGNETHQPVADGLDLEGIFITLKGWYVVDAAHSAAWRKQAREDFDFVNGKQLTDTDKRILSDSKRPVITFNRTLPIIKAVCGLEINTRQETMFLPRKNEPGEVRANEILSGASQWMADGCDAEDEQSEAFYDTTICGMGWTEITVEHDIDPDGKYNERQFSPLEMVWDHTARAKNLQDARRIFRVKEMPLSEAREMFPDEDDIDLDASGWAMGVDDGKDDPKPVEERRLKLGESQHPTGKETVRIVQAQWFENEVYHRVADPATGELVNIESDQLTEYSRRLKEAGMPPAETAEMKRRVYKQAFIGDKVLGKVKPALCKDRFSMNCITGQADRNKGTWYGLVATMRDPQMWGNKWLSQTLHILNTTAKGGIIAEKDAFEDVREAQETYAQPDAITWVKKGAVANNKIMQKPGVGLPQGYVNLLQFAVDSIPQVTGINMEMLGLRDVNQPGVLEAHRKQSAMTILAPLMDSRRRFSKNVGRCRLDIIQRYMSDGRLIRVSGKEGVQELKPLLRDETAGEYEVIVDEAPTSANSKEQTWATIQQVMPAFKEMLTPEAVLTILEFSPLPSKLVTAFREMMEKANQPNPEAEEAKQFQKIAAIASEKRAQFESDAKVEKDKATADRTRIQGITDLIKAGVSVADAEIREAEALAIEGEPANPSDTGVGPEGMAIQPDAGAALSDLIAGAGPPQMPAVPQGGPPLPAVPDLEEYAARMARGEAE